jgi:hypothetical protein
LPLRPLKTSDYDTLSIEHAGGEAQTISQKLSLFSATSRA